MKMHGILVVLAMTALLTVTSSAAGRTQSTARTGEIAFLRVPNTNVFPLAGQLFVVRPDGSGLHAVTPPGTASSYAWSPDGKLIAYISEGSLFVVRSDGTGAKVLVRLVRHLVAAFSWSPDGRKIAFELRDHWGCRTLEVVPVDGGRPVLLHTTPVVPTKGQGCEVSWSPAGGEIAYDSIPGISEIRSDGTHPRRISRRGYGPQWSADGRKLAFSLPGGGSSGNGSGAFAVVGATGKDFHVVTKSAQYAYPFAWSPRGRQILYGHAGDKGIYVIGADGRNNRRVTGDSPPDWGFGSLAWSPTGSSIVYSGGPLSPPDNADLYVIGTNGQDKVQLTNTSSVDFAPSWAP